jgi:hypothetical protein
VIALPSAIDPQLLKLRLQGVYDVIVKAQSLVNVASCATTGDESETIGSDIGDVLKVVSDMLSEACGVLDVGLDDVPTEDEERELARNVTGGGAL